MLSNIPLILSIIAAIIVVVALAFPRAGVLVQVAVLLLALAVALLSGGR